MNIVKKAFQATAMLIIVLVLITPSIALDASTDEDSMIIPEQIQAYIAAGNMEIEVYEVYREQTEVFEPVYQPNQNSLEQRRSGHLKTEIYEIYREQTEVFEPIDLNVDYTPALDNSGISLLSGTGGVPLPGCRHSSLSILTVKDC